MNIRPARSDEYEAIRAFYHSLIDKMQDLPYFPCWEKDIYPTNEYLLHVIEQGEMYLGEVGNEIAGAMVVSREPDGNHTSAHWLTQAKAGEISTINLLCVHPRFAGRGLAKELVDWAIAHAKAHGHRVIRLDVWTENLPAEKLYRSTGFQYADTVRIHYDDDDWMDFKLFELRL